MTQFASLSLLGTTFDCECGRTHTVSPREVVYSPRCYSELTRIVSEVAGGGMVAVLMDVRTRDAAGERVCEWLEAAGVNVQQVLVPDKLQGGSPVCDDLTHDALITTMGRPALVVTVGSGVINDLGKWIAGERNVPYVSFATALSMNGYASANVAATLNGVKSAVWSKPAIAVVSDPEVIAASPYRLTTAGLGDILAKSVSMGDWHMGSMLFGDYFCQRCTSLISDIEPAYIDNPQCLRDHDPGVLSALFHGLVLTGLSMVMAGSSQPASGGEHVISHGLDMLSGLGRMPHDLHGRQVGVATLMMAELYQRVLSLESPDFNTPPAAPQFEFWGVYGPGMEKQFAAKEKKMNAAREKLSQQGEWDRLREHLSGVVRKPETVRGVLKGADGAWRGSDIGLSSQQVLDLLIHAREMRPRFTILDLAFLTGVLPGKADDIIAAV